MATVFTRPQILANGYEKVSSHGPIKVFESNAGYLLWDEDTGEASVFDTGVDVVRLLVSLGQVVKMFEVIQSGMPAGPDKVSLGRLINNFALTKGMALDELPIEPTITHVRRAPRV